MPTRRARSVTSMRPATAAPRYMATSAHSGTLNSNSRVCIDPTSVGPCAGRRALASCRGLALADLLRQRRHHLEDVTDDSKIGEAEDGSIGVLVDRHDVVTRLHARLVLDGSGDAAGDVDLGRHDLAGLAHLVLMRLPPGVYGGAARTHGRAQCVGCLLYTSPSPRDRTRSRMPSSA